MKRSLPQAVGAALLCVLGACNDGGSLFTVAPGALSGPRYPVSTVAFLVGVPVEPFVPTVRGVPLSWSIDPALPAGLSFNRTSGVISGVPASPLPLSRFTVSVENGQVTRASSLDLSVVRPPRFAFVPTASGDLARFAVDPASGRLLPAGIVAAPAGTTPTQLAVAGDGRTLLGLDSVDTGTSRLLAWRLDDQTGALTELDQEPLGPGPAQLVLGPGARHAYVTSSGADLVLAFRIDPGGLTAISTRASAAGPGALTTHVGPGGTGMRLVVASDGLLESFAIHPDSGELQRARTALDLAGATVQALATSRGGDAVFALLASEDSLVSYEVGMSGRLTEAARRATGPAPDAIAVHPLHDRLVVAAGGELSSFAVRPDAQLSEARGPFPLGTGATGLTFDPSGSFLWGTSVGANKVVVFEARAANGDLLQVASSPTTGGPTRLAFGVGDLPVQPSLSSIYVANEAASTITTFRVDAADGGLAQLSVPFPTGSLPSDLALDPSGNFLVSANRGQASLSVFRINPTTFTLTPVDTTVAAPAQPVALAFGRGGAHLFVLSDGSNKVSSFRFDSATGALDLLDQRPVDVRPSDLVLDPSGQLLVAAGGPNGVLRAWRIDAGRFVGSSTMAAALPGAARLAFTPSADRLLVTCRDLDRLLVFDVDLADGSLTPAGPGAVTDDAPGGLAVDPSGRFVRVALGGPFAIGGLADYRLNSNGTLAALGVTSAGRQPRDVLLHPGGRFAYAPQQGSNDVGRWAVNAASGTLEPLDATFSGTAPVAIAGRRVLR